MAGKLKRIWFVVADSARASFYELNAARTGLISSGVKEMEAPDARIPTRELKSDRPGRSFSSGRGGVRHAYEPQHDYHKSEKHKFIESVADTLDKACAAGEFDQLVLVAAKRSLGELRSALSPRVEALVVEELGKDLTGQPAEALWQHLAPIAGRFSQTAA